MDVARSADIPATTVSNFIDALESLFLITQVPGYFTNLNKRLTKAPKVYFVDSGLLTHQLGISRSKPWEHREWGQLVETFVVSEIRKQIGWAASDVQLYHYRTYQGQEIDLILENRQQEIIGVEIKTSKSISSDFSKNFSYLKDDTGDKFKMGIVIYMGQTIDVLQENVYAIPLSCII